ncbi:MAG TPA: hypothetical protein VFE96_08135 [Candidatus Bathyarchaeia archaeon]|nr:hypothetical protein [Candidatus Bathyarchaeia archaeon]
MREYFGSLSKGQLWLFTTQIALLALTFLRYLSILFVAPIVITLAAIWGWLDYTKKTHRTALELLSQFELLLDDFGKLNFEQGGESEDKRIVKLLDIVPVESNTIRPGVASAEIPSIKDLFRVFQFWYFSMRDKVRIMMRKAGVLLDYDVVELANDFVEFYNGYLNKIAEKTLKLVSKRELVSSERAREIFKNFTDRSSELRGRGNAFLRKLRSHGYSISGMDIQPFGPDPWADLSAEPIQRQNTEYWPRRNSEKNS